jgi:hypothetical protein
MAVVTDRADVERFVAFERQLLVGSRFIAEPDETIVDRLLGTAQCLREGTCDRRLIDVRDGDVVVARCAALVNHSWQAVDPPSRAKTGFIGYFAAAPDAEGRVLEMLAEAEEWLVGEKEMERAIMGCNGNALLGLGILTDGFDDYEPMFPLSWNPPHYAQYILAAGYRPTYPWWVYEVDFRTPAFQRFKQRVLAADVCEIRPIDIDDFKNEIERLRKVFNDGFRGEWEMQEFTPEEFWELFAWMETVVDPKMMLFAYVDGEPEPVGFAYGFADWTPSFRRLDGALPSPAFLRKLAREPVTRAGGIAYACRPGFTHLGIGPRLGVELYGHFQELGLTSGLYYPVNDHNGPSRTVADRLGGCGRILYTCFDKPLSGS